MLIAGAGGFAKELLFVFLQLNPNEQVVFFDDYNKVGPDIFLERYKILKNNSQVEAYFKEVDNRFLIGIGNPVLRKKMMNDLQKLGGVLNSLTAASVQIGTIDNLIGTGTTILSNVVIEINNSIGIGCLIHNGAFISHDIVLGDYCEISPSVNILGGVKVGHYCSIGTAAVILPKITIGNNVIVGAGAVVTANVPDNSLVIGIPAKLIKKLPPVTDY